MWRILITCNISPHFIQIKINITYPMPGRIEKVQHEGGSGQPSTINLLGHKYQVVEVHGFILWFHVPPRDHISLEETFTGKRCTIVAELFFSHQLNVVVRLVLIFRSASITRIHNIFWMDCARRVLWYCETRWRSPHREWEEQWLLVTASQHQDLLGDVGIRWRWHQCCIDTNRW